MRLSENDKKYIKTLYRNELKVEEIEKLLNNNFQEYYLYILKLRELKYENSSRSRE